MSSLSESYSVPGLLTVITSVNWPSDYFTYPAIPSNLTYGLQRALTPTAHSQDLLGSSSQFSHWKRYYLFNDSCVASNGTYSCFDHCNDPVKTFSSLPYLHNCVVGMFLPNMTNSSHIQASSGIGYDGPDLKITVETNSTAQQMGDTIEKCFASGCDSFPACKQSLSGFHGYSQSNGVIHNLQQMGSSMIYSLCLEIKSQLDSDIGGVGVYVSYWVQACLALLGLVGVLILKFILPHVHQIDRLGIQRISPPDYRKSARKHLSRLIVFLTDFHKAQCFFMLATNVAAIVTFKHGGIDVQSMQQVYNNYIFLKIIALSGFLPISFTLFILHLVHMTSWYLISLSCASISLSIATLAVLGTFEIIPNDYKSLQELAGGDGPDVCGNIQPWIYCYETMQTSYTAEDSNLIDLDRQAYIILGFCLVVVALVVASKLGYTERECVQRWLLFCYNWFLKFCRAVARLISRARTSHTSPPSIIPHIIHAYTVPLVRFWHKYPNPPEWAVARAQAYELYHLMQTTHQGTSHRYPKYIYVIIQPIVYLTLLILYLTYFTTFMRYLAWFARTETYNNSWNFGQVVALSVWAPVIAEWVHLEFRGMRRGMEYKLLLPYQITTGLSLGTLGVRTGIELRKPEDDEENGLLKERAITGKHDEDDERGKNRRCDDFEDAPLHSQASESQYYGSLVRTHSRTASSITALEEEEQNDKKWVLPEPELPSRAITLSRRLSGSSSDFESRI